MNLKLKYGSKSYFVIVKTFCMNINRFYEFVDHCYNQCLFEVCDVSKCGM